MLLLPMPQLPYPCITLCYLCHLINLGLATYGIKNILHQSQFISLHSSAKTRGQIVTMEGVKGNSVQRLGASQNYIMDMVFSETDIQDLFWALLDARYDETWLRSHLRMLLLWGVFSSKGKLLKLKITISQGKIPLQNLEKSLQKYKQERQTLSNRYFYISSCVRNQERFLSLPLCLLLTLWQ